MTNSATIFKGLGRIACGVLEDRLEQEFGRVAVKKRRMLIVRQVVHQQTPIAVISAPIVYRKPLRRIRDAIRKVAFEWNSIHIAHEQPDKSSMLPDRIRFNSRALGWRDIAAFHKLCHAFPGCTVEGPSVIGAADRSATWIKAVAHRQRCTAVRASIGESEHLAAVAKQHDLFTQKSYSFWLLTQSPTRDGRIPVVAQPKRRKFALVIAFLKCLVQVCFLSRPNLRGRQQRQILRRYSRRH